MNYLTEKKIAMMLYMRYRKTDDINPENELLIA